MCDTGEPPLSKSAECRTFHQQKATQRDKDAKRLGVPLIFTEFGACFNSEECATEVKNSADAFESVMASWLYWQYKSFRDFTTTGGVYEGMFLEDGEPQQIKLRQIARTYVHAYQGIPLESFFDSTNGAYKTTFELDTSVGAPTEMFANQGIWYSAGLDVIALDSNNNLLDFTQQQNADSEHYQQFAFDENLNGKQITLLATERIHQR